MPTETTPSLAEQLVDPSVFDPVRVALGERFERYQALVTDSEALKRLKTVVAFEEATRDLDETAKAELLGLARRLLGQLRRVLVAQKVVTDPSEDPAVAIQALLAFPQNVLELLAAVAGEVVAFAGDPLDVLDTFGAEKVDAIAGGFRGLLIAPVESAIDAVGGGSEAMMTAIGDTVAKEATAFFTALTSVETLLDGLDYADRFERLSKQMTEIVKGANPVSDVAGKLRNVSVEGLVNLLLDLIEALTFGAADVLLDRLGGGTEVAATAALEALKALPAGRLGIDALIPR